MRKSIHTFGVALVALSCAGTLNAQQSSRAITPPKAKTPPAASHTTTPSDTVVPRDAFAPDDRPAPQSDFAPGPMEAMPVMPAIIDSPYKNSLATMAPNVVGYNVSRGGCDPMSPGPCCYGPGDYNNYGCWGCNWGDGAGACGACGGAGCGGGFDCDACCGDSWFAGFGGLIMTRDSANGYGTTNDVGDPSNILMDTADADVGWNGGYQATIGYLFGGARAKWGLAFTYWGLAPLRGSASVVSAGNTLGTPIDMTTPATPDLGGDPVTNFFVNCHEQRIWRTDNINSFELNTMYQPYNAAQWIQLTWLVGFRYFRFAEDLRWGGVESGFEFGDNGGANEAYLEFRDINNLYGAQIGTIANLPISRRFAVYMIPKAGIYGNQIDGRTSLYRGDGTAAAGYPIVAEKWGTSLLLELDAGCSYQITRRLRFWGGYRAVGITGVALADNQFQPYLSDTDGFADLANNGSVIIHGGYAGLGWSF